MHADAGRRAEVKHEPDLKGIRWGTLRSKMRASGRPNRRDICTGCNDRASKRHVRGAIKQALRKVFSTATNVAQAEQLLKAWIIWARRCRLAPFKRLGATVRKHADGILEHFRSGLSKGFAEGLNGRVQAAKARARGYGTDRHLITISYLICAHLKHLPKNPWLHPNQAVAG